MSSELKGSEGGEGRKKEREEGGREKRERSGGLSVTDYPFEESRVLLQQRTLGVRVKCIFFRPDSARLCVRVCSSSSRTGKSSNSSSSSSSSNYSSSGSGSGGGWRRCDGLTLEPLS